MKLHHDVPTLGSLLIASPDPESLERWYSDLVSFGNVSVLYDKRDEITGDAAEPTRYILNFHCNDIKSVCARLDENGAEWVSKLEERDGGMFFATVKDPDGNYVQIIQVGDQMIRDTMPTQPYSGFAVKDIDAARTFYSDVLGVRVVDLDMGGLSLVFGNNNAVLVYPKPNHEPADFTILNFPVENIDEEVDKLVKSGVIFERYEGFDHDERGIMRGSGGKGPDIAWFTDPSGNILSLTQI